jgi:hypothetical protein
MQRFLFYIRFFESQYNKWESKHNANLNCNIYNTKNIFYIFYILQYNSNITNKLIKLIIVIE